MLLSEEQINDIKEMATKIKNLPGPNLVIRKESVSNALFIMLAHIEGQDLKMNQLNMEIQLLKAKQEVAETKKPAAKKKTTKKKTATTKRKTNGKRSTKKNTVRRNTEKV